MKNKLADLNNHLFAQLERLSEEGLSVEQIDVEVKRTDAIVDVAEQIVRNADLQLKAATIIANHGEIAMPTISAHTYKLSIQVPESWLIPSAPRTSINAMAVT